MAKKGRTLDVKSIRSKTGLSQEGFAEAFGFALNSLRNWEQGRAGLTEAVYTYLCLIDMFPSLMKTLARRLQKNQSIS